MSRLRMISVVAVVVATLFGAGVAAAQPTGGAATSTDPIMRTGRLLGSPVAPDGSSIPKFVFRDKRTLSLLVHSTAMNRDYRVDVQRPADPSKPRPALYLLSGLDAGYGKASWAGSTSVLKFLAAKDVNVVQPIGGIASYYADWIKPDPIFGVNKWRTFLLDELPPLVNGALGTDGRNAIAGTSMSATSVLQLAEARPGFYRSVAAYSGCAQISDPIGYQVTKLVVDKYNGTIDDMYGPQGDPRWAANDPLVHADRLRGENLFISAGSGLPGPHENENDPHLDRDPGAGLGNEIIVGGVLEAAVNYCTHNLRGRLDALGIPATYDFTPTGTHSWGYWEDALLVSWPVLAAGLGLPA